jgi:hypothetical protein
MQLNCVEISDKNLRLLNLMVTSCPVCDVFRHRKCPHTLKLTEVDYVKMFTIIKGCQLTTVREMGSTGEVIVDV